MPTTLGEGQSAWKEKKKKKKKPSYMPENMLTLHRKANSTATFALQELFK